MPLRAAIRPTAGVRRTGGDCARQEVQGPNAQKHDSENGAKDHFHPADRSVRPKSNHEVVMETTPQGRRKTVLPRRHLVHSLLKLPPRTSVTRDVVSPRDCCGVVRLIALRTRHRIIHTSVSVSTTWSHHPLPDDCRITGQLLNHRDRDSARSLCLLLCLRAPNQSRFYGTCTRQARARPYGPAGSSHTI